MRNMAGMMKKVHEMQTRLKNLQVELENQHFSAGAANDCITVTVTGSGTLHAVKIDRSIIDPEDTEILEDLICLATRNAQAAALSLIHICRCRRYSLCRSRWSPYH